MSIGARMRAAAYRLAWGVLHLWWFARRPRSSGVRCVLRRGDAVVLVRHTYGDQRWMLPGGRSRRGEDPLATAQREMRHELGLVGAGWRVVGRVGARTRYRRTTAGEPFRRHSTFYVEAEAEAPGLAPRGGELSDAGWFRPAALPDDRSASIELAIRSGWL